jgi:iron complex outermembrane recepter protein
MSPTFLPLTVWQMIKLFALPTVVALILLNGATALADGKPRQYNIPAQSLNNALMQFAADSNLKLLLTADTVRGMNANAIEGSMTSTQALDQLLQDSGMSYRFVDAGTVTIEPVPSNFKKTTAVIEPPQSNSGQNSEQTLPKVTVEADARYDPDVESDPLNPSYHRSNASTATKTDTPLLETPLTVQVVPQKLIRDRGMQKPNDLAEVVAGVQPNVGYGNTASQYFLIRGFSNNGLNYRNGFRLNEVYTPRDLANVERVEFVKGPASVLYGTNQPGGAVNTITKKPINLDFISTKLTGGSFDRFRGSIDANKKIGDFAMRLNVAGDTQDSYIDFESSHNWLVAPVLSYQITPDTKILYEAEFQDTQQNGWSNGLPNSLDTLKLPVNRTMSEPFAYFNNFNHSHHLEFNHQFNQDWAFRQGLYYARTDRSFLTVNSGFPSVADSITNLTRIKFGMPDEHQEHAISQTELTGHFKTWEADHQMLAGFERIHSVFSFLGDFSDYDTGFNLVNPVYSGKVPVIEPNFGSRRTSDTYAVYLQDQIKWENWRLLAGWRHDEVESSEKDLLAGTSIGQSEGADTGRVGLLYAITPSTSIYYSFSQSFFPNVGADVNGQILKADRGNQHEIGIKHSVWKGLDFTLSLFDILRENVVGQAPGTAFGRVNNGDQRSRGIETSLTGDVTSDFHIITNLTFLDASVEKGDPDKVGDRLFGVPKFSANAWGLYDLPLTMIPGKLSTGFGVVHFGEREASLPNTVVKMPAYTRFDMGLFYIYKGVNLALNLRNLTDEKYYDTLEGSALHAQPPFNWAVTVGYDFE